jgi:hypothetical protein
MSYIDITVGNLPDLNWKEHLGYEALVPLNNDLKYFQRFQKLTANPISPAGPRGPSKPRRPYKAS